MKKKYYAISILLIFMLTIGFTMAGPDNWRDNTLFSFVDDVQNSLNNTPNSPAIQGKNAMGENQTTVIDQNGNLKMIENKGASSNTTVEMPTNPADGNASSTMNSSLPSNTRAQQPPNAVPQTNSQGPVNAVPNPVPPTGSGMSPTVTSPSSMSPAPSNPTSLNPVPLNPAPMNAAPRMNAPAATGNAVSGFDQPGQS